MIEHSLQSVGIADAVYSLGRESRPISNLADKGYISEQDLSLLYKNRAKNYHIDGERACETVAAEVVHKLLNDNGVDPEDIDALVFTSTIYEATALFPDRVVQSIALKTGCRRAKIFSLHHAYCISPFLAIKIMMQLLPRLEKREPKAVIVCADRMGTNFDDLRTIGQMGVHSDGAAAILLTTTGPRRIIHSLDLAMTSSSLPPVSSNGHVVANPLFFARLHKALEMALRPLSDGSKEVLCLCSNNLNALEWEQLARRLRIKGDNICNDPGIGHVFGADPFINLTTEKAKSHPLQLLAATAAGSAYATALLEQVKS